MSFGAVRVRQSFFIPGLGSVMNGSEHAEA